MLKRFQFWIFGNTLSQRYCITKPEPSAGSLICQSFDQTRFLFLSFVNRIFLGIFFVSSTQIFGDHYHFHHREVRKRSVGPAHQHQHRLNNDDRVQWSQQQRIKSRKKRDFLSFHDPPTFPIYTMGKNRLFTTDPKWSQMWYLVSK